VNRRLYLDWLRGVGVLIMIEAHTLDSWTRVADHQRAVYGWAIIIGGFGAPIFLFLAGVALALATGSRMWRGHTSGEAAAMARKRGWQILGLAFLFRLQSWLISGGSPQTLLKVDILNIMGLAMVAAGLLWMLGRGRMSRTVLFASAAAAATLLTPIVRQTTLLSPLPDPLEWYLRPAVGRTTFTLLPWAGFLFAGAATGVWVDAARTDRQEARLNLVLLFVGTFVAIAAYAASFLPPVYAESNFWTSSPTFFFLRVGVLLMLLPSAYGWNRLVTGRSPLREFGAASLFVYWIHVEMVYGVLSAPLHKRLTLEQAVVAFAVFSVFLFGLVKLKDAVPWRKSLDLRRFAPRWQS
jgi:uncharacterized membrane protein